ncbi:MAG: hypothetical protein M0Z54_05275 [Thermaerobacter sp.]|nr:hypothetical protein [Thermaerobacter sp.]
MGRLEAWGLLTWHPRPGRARRSEVVLHVHPVHVYYERLPRGGGGALGRGRLLAGRGAGLLSLHSGGAGPPGVGADASRSGTALGGRGAVLCG